MNTIQVLVTFSKDKVASFVSLSDKQISNLVQKISDSNELHNPFFLFFVADEAVQVPPCLQSGKYQYGIVNISSDDFLAQSLKAIENKMISGKNVKFDCVIICVDSIGEIVAINSKNQPIKLTMPQIFLYYSFLAKYKINTTIEFLQENIDKPFEEQV